MLVGSSAFGGRHAATQPRRFALDAVEARAIAFAAAPHLAVAWGRARPASLSPAHTSNNLQQLASGRGALRRSPGKFRTIQHTLAGPLRRHGRQKSSRGHISHLSVHRQPFRTIIAHWSRLKARCRKPLQRAPTTSMAPAPFVLADSSTYFRSALPSALDEEATQRRHLVNHCWNGGAAGTDPPGYARRGPPQENEACLQRGALVAMDRGQQGSPLAPQQDTFVHRQSCPPSLLDAPPPSLQLLPIERHASFPSNLAQ